MFTLRQDARVIPLFQVLGKVQLRIVRPEIEFNAMPRRLRQYWSSDTLLVTVYGFTNVMSSIVVF